jgi:hypothetical protein
MSPIWSRRRRWAEGSVMKSPNPTAIALIGSSGGGCANLSSSPSSALAVMQEELQNVGITLSAVQFIHCCCPLDRATGDSASALWVLDRPGGSIVCRERGALSLINNLALAEDLIIGEQIRQGQIHGLVSISSDFGGETNQEHTPSEGDMNSEISFLINLLWCTKVSEWLTKGTIYAKSFGRNLDC